MEHGVILRTCFDAVQHMAGGDDGAAVDVDAHVGVDTGVGAEGTGSRCDGAAVDHQPAVGVDAVALAGFSGDPDRQAAAVDGGDGHAVLIGVDAVIAGDYGNIAAVQGQVQLAVQTLIFSVNVQNSRVFRAAVHVHGHSGVESAVVLMQFFGVLHFGSVLAEHQGAGLVDPGHIGAPDGVDTAVGDDNIGACGAGVHIFGGLSGVIASAFVDIVEDHRGGNPAGDVRSVQNQGHNGGGILFDVLAQIHGDLTGGEGAADAVGAGAGDVEHGMGGGFFGGVGIGFGAFAIGEVLAGFVVNDVVGGVNAAAGIRLQGDIVQGDAGIGQTDVCRVTPGRRGGGFRDGGGIGLRGRGGSAGGEEQGKQQGKQFPGFHGISQPFCVE